MTCILSMPCRDGIVICGDTGVKPLYTNEVKVEEKIIKIYHNLISQTTGFVSFGTVDKITAEKGPNFDVSTIIQTCKKRFAGTTIEFIHYLHEQITLKLSKFCEATLIPKHCLGEDNHMFSIFLNVYLKPTEVTYFRIKASVQNNSPTVKLIPTHVLLSSESSIYGGGVTWFLTDLKNKKYHDKNELYLNYFSKPRAISNIASEEGMALCKAIITDTCNLNRTDNHYVNDIIDIGVLYYKTGFEWIEKNSPNKYNI